MDPCVCHRVDPVGSGDACVCSTGCGCSTGKNSRSEAPSFPPLQGNAFAGGEGAGSVHKNRHPIDDCSSGTHSVQNCVCTGPDARTGRAVL